MDDFLPVGSVVKIKESDAYLMIIGYDCSKNNKSYDYVSVFHLGGIGFQPYNRDEDLVLFNRDSVQEVCFIGYTDEEINKKLQYMKIMKSEK